MAAPKHACQQCFTPPRRSTYKPTFHGRIMRDLELIRLILIPRDIALVMRMNEDLPLLLRKTVSGDAFLAALHDPGNGLRSSKRIRTCVDRVCQDMVDHIVNREAPYDSAPFGTVSDRRHLRALLAQPHQYLSDATEVSELAKHEINGFANTPIWIDLHSIIGSTNVADRHGRIELTASCLLHQCFLRPLT